MKTSIFENLISNLVVENKPNIVIGGSTALVLHGLNIGREKGDLDLIIYCPTESQKAVLKVLEPFNIVDKGHISYGKSRVYKFQIEGHSLDIILEEEPLPQNLLLTKVDLLSGGSYYFPVQSISNVIKAKNSYTYSHTTQKCMYSRVKDMKDLLELKNLNFNFE